MSVRCVRAETACDLLDRLRLDVGALLRQTPDRCAGGVWRRLSKPGLGGRERWLGRDDSHAVYVKRYLHPALREQLDRILRQSVIHSRGWCEYARACELNAAQIGAPRPLACAERMLGPLERRSAVVLDEAPGEALERLWPKLCERGSRWTRPPLRHELVRRLGWFVAAFHSTGLCHRDLYLCHVFAVLDEDAACPPRFVLIDLARLFRPLVRRMRWVLKDLSQLDSSARQLGIPRTDRLRFLVAYLGLAAGSPRVRWYARRIQRRSDRILRRIERKARTGG